jgi:hypothetical protein
MAANLAILTGIWDSLLNHLPDILKAASSNVLGLLALIVVALAVIAAVALSGFKKFEKLAGYSKLAAFFGAVAFMMFVGVLFWIASPHESPKPQPSADSSLKPRVIAGRIVDQSNDQGVPRLTVLLEGVSAPAPRSETDSQGNFRFSPLQIGDIGALLLSLESTDYEPRSQYLPPSENIENLRIFVRKAGAKAARQSASSATPPRTHVAGKVIDGATHSPIPDAMVELRGYSSPAPEEHTDSRGNFVFDVALARPASVRILVSRPGYQPYDQILSPGEDWKDLDIRLSAVASK